MRDLGAFPGQPGSTPFAEGVAVNNAGQVAGFSAVGGGLYRAFRYDGTPGAGGVMHGLSGPGFFGFSAGDAINDAGQVAGSGQITGSTAFHAFRYDGTPGAGGVMRDLGTLGGTNSYGRAINDMGDVAGYSEITGSTAYHAFLYTGTPGAGGQMIDLDIWLNATNPTEGAKWMLSGASGLSDTGWITGTGSYDPDGPGGVAAAERAYLLDASSLVVPEPSGLAPLGVAAVSLLRRRRAADVASREPTEGRRRSLRASNDVNGRG
jgi:probable HAF family extracellular repeat protein